MHVVIPLLLASLLLSSCGSGDRDDSIRILWANFAPADILSELGRQYEQETGIAVRVVKKSWDGAFTDATYAEFRNRAQNYDIIIGDSQWLGLGTVGGHYLELTDWMHENLALDEIEPVALTGYSEYPKGSGRYYAVPCEADAMVWAYRKDLFEDPNHQNAFQEFLRQKGVDKPFPLAPPETWENLRLIAAYFKESIPGMAGVMMVTSRSYDMATMSFQQILHAFGGKFGDYSTNEVLFDSPETVKALTFFSDLLETSTPGGKNMGYSEVGSEYISGRAAMVCNFLALLPSFASPSENPDYHDKTGYFNSPSHTDESGVTRRYTSFGGQGMSVNAHINAKRQGRAKDFIKWFASREIQRIWAVKGGLSANLEVLKSQEFLDAAPYNHLAAEAFSLMRDFWTVPEYDELLKVTQREITSVYQQGADARDAAAQVQKEHEMILKRRGRIK